MIHPRTLQALEFPKIQDYLARLCATEAGKNLVLKLKPLDSAEEARHELDIYQESRVFFAHPQKSSRQPYHLPPIPEIGELLADDCGSGEGANNVRLDLDKLWAIREMLNAGAAALDALSNSAGQTLWPRLLQKAGEIAMPVELSAALNRCVSDDGALKDESSPELHQLRNEIRNINRTCLNKVKDFAERYNIRFLLQDEFLTLSNDRYVLPMKANFKGKIQGIIHDWSQTGETCYFEPFFLIEINNQLQELKFREREEEKRIIAYLENLFLQYFSEARAVSGLLGMLDFLHAKGAMAEALDCECISYCEMESGAALFKARHPLLLLARSGESASSGPKPVSPLDLVLKPGDKSLIITGGNAGGKTVCLKTFGLLAAMSACGLPVPVDKGSYLPWFDRIDAFIGDEQSLTDNVSTFTAQIDHLVKAWKHFDGNSLALLDEFGAGTDPAEGSALAQAVMDALLEKNCFILSATHFPALKNYALTKEGVRAATMLFEPLTNKPLFKIAYDQVGASQALIIAEDRGLPQTILGRARHYLLQGDENPASIITKLNDLCVIRENEAMTLAKEREKYGTMLKREKEKLEKQRLELRDEISARIRDIHAAFLEKRLSAKNALRDLHQLKESLASQEEAQDSPAAIPQTLAPGDEAYHLLFQKRGVVTEIDARKNRARIDMNGVHVWAAYKHLKAAAPLPAQSAVSSSGLAKVKNSAPLTYTLDLRGLRSAEAVEQLEKTLDKMLLDGYTEIDIIHGKGAGILRREIQAFLKGAPHIADFSPASEEFGGDGVTRARLK